MDVGHAGAADWRGVCVREVVVTGHLNGTVRYATFPKNIQFLNPNLWRLPVVAQIPQHLALTDEFRVRHLTGGLAEFVKEFDDAGPFSPLG